MKEEWIECEFESACARDRMCVNKRMNMCESERERVHVCMNVCVKGRECVSVSERDFICIYERECV